MAAMEKPLPYSKQEKPLAQCSHRTLVIVYESKDHERIIRLITSLNTSDTIKADVITIGKDGTLYFGYYQNEINIPVQIDKVKETLKALSPYIEEYKQVIEINRWNTLLNQKDSTSPALVDGQEE